MPVLGTSGHVDHGKTALITALTGIETDRLPEEKARGMTTDLGFAHFSDLKGGKIGVIDVPGHERYIRNMAAGASGIDAAILVIASDDGWMEQTERHVRVLEAFGVPIAVVALTKISLVTEDRVRELTVAIRERLYARMVAPVAVSGQGSRMPASNSQSVAPFPVCPVDSLSGAGIGELKQTLITILARGLKPARQEPAFPHLFVDRIFPLKGTGIVVAGTLRGASLAGNAELALYPGRERIRIRGLQAYGIPAQHAEPGSRIAFALARPRREVRRGDCIGLHSDSPLLEGRRSAYLEKDSYSCGAWKTPTKKNESGRDMAVSKGISVPQPECMPLRAGMEVEIAAGTSSRIAKLFPAKKPGFVRISWEEAFSLHPEQRVVLIRHGGADILLSGKVAAFGGEKAEERKRIEKNLGLPAPPECGPGPAGPAGSSGSGHPASPAGSSGLALPAGRARSSESSFLSGQTEKQSGKGACQTPAPSVQAKAFLSGLLYSGEPGFDESAAGTRNTPGMDVKTLALARQNEKKIISELCTLDLLISLDGGLFMPVSRYFEYVASVLGSRSAGSTIGIQEAKSATNLSRKWVIPLLVRMERDGYLKRSGDTRIVTGKTLCHSKEQCVDIQRET